MSARMEIVTIDGPAGVGKSTISRMVAAALGFTYLDTGAMYRAVAYFLHRRSIALENESVVAEALLDLELELLPAADADSDVGVRIAGEDVSGMIRTPEMSMAASAVSKQAAVRAKLTHMQQELGRAEKVVAEGRDTGTVVFPSAAYKFFLDATPEERAQRRVKQLRDKGQPVDEAEILALTIERDRNDRQRALAPLRQADDAVLIDTTSLTVAEVCRQVLESITRVRSAEKSEGRQP